MNDFRFGSLGGPFLAVLLAWVFWPPSIVHGIAGMNPATLGLPVVDNVYGLPGSVPLNGASAMCIACHSAVPVAGKGSHFVRNHTGGTSRTTNGQAAKERLDPWTSTAIRSKYGNFSATVTSVTGSNGEMICESCHNIINNAAGGNNLVEHSFPWDLRPNQPATLSSNSTTLCEGCHVTASLPNHHPMTGDITSNGLVLNNTDPNDPFTRVYVDNALNPNGTLTNLPVGSTSETFYGSVASGTPQNRLNCLSCHGNGHTGFTGTGARILRRGWAGASTPNNTNPPLGVVGTAASGVDRQFDKDSSGNVRLITNWQPLCDACHKVDD